MNIIRNIIFTLASPLCYNKDDTFLKDNLLDGIY